MRNMLRALALFLCLFTAATAQTKLDADAATLRYDDLALDLAATPPGPEHDLFAGVLADRTNPLDEAITLLTPLADDTTLSPARRAHILGSLADAHLKLFHYAQSSEIYTRLHHEAPPGHAPPRHTDDQDDADTIKLLLDAPPQTISFNTPGPTLTDIPTSSDRLASITADLTAHNITAPWILDTGANFSVVSESFARQLGLTLSTGVAHTQGATGAENPLHVAILDTLPLGAATLHNVVLLVLPDANLTIGTGKKKTYVIPAILGYPVFQALGIIRFTHDHRFQAGPATPPRRRRVPHVLRTHLHGEAQHPLLRSHPQSLPPLPLRLRRQRHQLLPPLLPRVRRRLPPRKARNSATATGAGGTLHRSSLHPRPRRPRALANRIVNLPHIAAFKNPQNTLSDEYEGSLGRDLINALDTLTLDLIHNRVYPGKPRN